MPKLEHEFTVRVQVMVTPGTKSMVEALALRLTPQWSKTHSRWQGNQSALLRRAIAEFIMNHRNDESIIDLNRPPE